VSSRQPHAISIDTALIVWNSGGTSITSYQDFGVGVECQVWRHQPSRSLLAGHCSPSQHLCQVEQNGFDARALNRRIAGVGNHLTYPPPIYPREIGMIASSDLSLSNSVKR
jgi:hypothetical protein